MSTFDRPQLIAALTRLGELAAARGETVRLFVVGGARVVLTTGARRSTRDVDAVVLAPSPTSRVRRLVELVAEELGLPLDWLNDGAKGYIGNRVDGSVIFSADGIEVLGAPDAQMLALKLWAWRDDVDIDDAKIHLLRLTGTREEIWDQVERYVSAPSALTKVHLAYTELWELTYGSD